MAKNSTHLPSEQYWFGHLAKALKWDVDNLTSTEQDKLLDMVNDMKEDHDQDHEAKRVWDLGVTVMKV